MPVEPTCPHSVLTVWHVAHAEFDHPTPELNLIPDTDNVNLHLLSSSQFDFSSTFSVRKHLFDVPQRNTTWDQVTFIFHADRIWASTFLNNMVPIVFIVGMAIFAFAMPRDYSEARVSICITAFLAAMAFSVTLQVSQTCLRSFPPPVPTHRRLTRPSMWPRRARCRQCATSRA